MVTFNTSLTPEERQNIVKVVGREGSIDILKSIMNHGTDAYLAQIQRNVNLSRQTIKNRLDELLSTGIIRAVPDSIHSEPGGRSILVKRYEIVEIYSGIFEFLFKED